MVHYKITVHRGSSTTEVEDWVESRMMSTSEMTSKLDTYVSGGQSAVLHIGIYGRYPEPMVEVIRAFDENIRVFPGWKLLTSMISRAAKAATRREFKADTDFKMNDFDAALDK